MSRDSSHHHIHLSRGLHADLFEEFCRPPSLPTHPSLSSSHNQSNQHNHHTQHPISASNPTNNTTADAGPGMQHVPGSFLPYEEIYLPPELMPVNPEDEDGVVPDMHAAFGIERALGHAGGSASAAVGVGSGGYAGGTGERSTAGRVGERVWRDLGMERILDGDGGAGLNGSGNGNGEISSGTGGGGGGVNGLGSAGITRAVVTGARREGRRTGVLLLR